MSDKSIRIDEIAIIGGGQVGRGIAWLAASKGLKVTVIEKDAAATTRAKEQLGREMDEEIARWGLTGGEKRATLARIAFMTRPSSLGPVLVVIEAVPEDAEIKREVYERLAPIITPDTVIASSTGAIPIDELAAVSKVPERFVGLRFNLPLLKRGILEITPSRRTTEASLQKIQALVKRLGKQMIVVKGPTGAISVRCILPMLHAAITLLEEKVATAEEIDTSMRLGFGLFEGPLALADRIGLDTVLAWMKEIGADGAHGECRPCPLLEQLVTAGKLGVKSGEGFFRYGGEGFLAGEAAR